MRWFACATVLLSACLGSGKATQVSLSGVTGSTGAGSGGAGNGDGPVFSLSPMLGSFGFVNQGGTGEATLTVTNGGGVGAGSLAFSITGADAADFYVSGGTCVTDQLLEPGASCTITITFEPDTAGDKTATLSVTGSLGAIAEASLQGTSLGAPVLSFTASMVSPGAPVSVGSTVTLTVTLQNTGTAASGALPSFQTTSNTEFTVIAGGTCSSGSVLVGGGSCTILVSFAPASYGDKTDTLSVQVTPGAASPISINLGGTGSQTFTLTVGVSGGTGASKVTSTPAGDINCGAGGSLCSHMYTVTSTPPQVTLAQTTGASQRFVGFSGACSGASCATLTIDGSKNVAATWQQTFQASVTIAGTGAGSVSSTSSPTQAAQFSNCTSGTCNVTFDNNMNVTLTGAPSGSVLTWSGGVSCSGSGTCQLNNANRTATATFNSVYTLTVAAVTQTDGTNGRITSSPGSISCTGTGTCTQANIPAGTVYTLTADPQSVTNGLVSWGGDCSASTGLTCTLTMNQNYTNVRATFAPYNQIFVTNTATGSTGGSPAAYDNWCRSLAAGRPGATGYVAWISSNGNTAYSRITALNAGARGWVRPDGLPFTDTFTGLTSQNVVYYPPKVTETGATVGAGVTVVTATTPGGTFQTGYDCNGWTGSGSSSGGDSNAGSGAWTGWFTGGNCALTSRIYCLGTKYQTPVRQAYTSGRRAFVTANGYRPGANYALGNGRFMSHAQADNICRDEASNASPKLCPDNTTLNCKFVALLADAGWAPIAFIANQSGTPWVRVDGVRLASTAAALFTSSHDAAWSTLPSAGMYSAQGARNWTGSWSVTGVPATTGDTCSGWTDGVSGSGGYIGVTNATDSQWFTWTNIFGCGGSNPIYCIEDKP